ncbi:MAG TPA: RHS repeat-associated core domain-containing protein, partial [Hyphomicrobiales bacterium]|nr:RHS repeat-associated core domain-containing protein [Hyphomicrobiales bacterium]
IVWSAHYHAWGAAKEAISDAARAAGIRNPIRFQGQYLDSETGLHYNRHRYYDPQIGRFISKDPIGFSGGLNIYQYAHNPIEWLDPLGLAGARGVLRAQNIPGGSQWGLSSGEGGRGITNAAVKAAYDNVPLIERSEYHGACAEADALSKAANAGGIETLDELKDLVQGGSSQTWRNDKKGKPMPACGSCAHVQRQLGIRDDCPTR